MTKDEKDKIEHALNALERLMRMFAVERVVYLVGSLASLLLFIYAGYNLFSRPDSRPGDIALLMGASGVSAACSSRVAYFLNRAFNLIEDIIRSLTNTLKVKRNNE